MKVFTVAQRLTVVEAYESVNAPAFPSPSETENLNTFRKNTGDVSHSLSILPNNIIALDVT